MTDKFAEYYSSDEKIQELSEYVHQNFKLIMVKMTSEMRRKLDMSPDLKNSNGYFSLIASLQGRMFNEMVYSLCGLCQSVKLNFEDIIPALTIDILLRLMKNENPMNGMIRNDVKEDLEEFKKYYLKEIDDLRKNKNSLPK